MKKIIALMISLSLVFALVACGEVSITTRFEEDTTEYTTVGPFGETFETSDGLLTKWVADDSVYIYKVSEKVLLGAKNALILGDLSNVKGDLTLPSIGKNQVDITWVSDNEAVLSNDGVVNLPGKGEENIKVTLTATITFMGDTTTKEFDARVMAAEWIKYDSLTQVILDGGIVA